MNYIDTTRHASKPWRSLLQALPTWKYLRYVGAEASVVELSSIDEECRKSPIWYRYCTPNCELLTKTMERYGGLFEEIWWSLDLISKIHSCFIYICYRQDCEQYTSVVYIFKILRYYLENILSQTIQVYSQGSFT